MANELVASHSSFSIIASVQRGATRHEDPTGVQAYYGDLNSVPLVILFLYETLLDSRLPERLK